MEQVNLDKSQPIDIVNAKNGEQQKKQNSNEH